MSRDKEKNVVNELKKNLFYNKKNAYHLLKDDEIKKSNKFSEGYKKFLNAAKTEREAVKYAVSAAEEKGFVEYKPGMKLSAGDKIFYNNREKAIILAVIGTDSLAKGARICAAHIDSPRLDLKQCPVYEDNELALFKTHYYGGIKKYQWTTIPLALHGVLVCQDGTKIEVNIGEDVSVP